MFIDLPWDKSVYNLCKYTFLLETFIIYLSNHEQVTGWCCGNRGRGLKGGGWGKMRGTRNTTQNLDHFKLAKSDVKFKIANYHRFT